MRQKTIAGPVEIHGKGLHTGREVKIVVTSEKADTGILFERVDLPGRPVLRADVGNVVNVDRCTVIGNGDFRISTVEHFMAAASGLGIDNLRVLIDGEEMPALDGSSRIYCEQFLSAGVKEQHHKKKRYTLRSSQFAAQGNAVILALPADDFHVTCLFESSHPMVPSQILEYIPSPESFVKEIAPARTFCFWEDVQQLREKNLALGGDLDNALVIKPDGFSTPPRFDGEMVRHKCLDLLGDAALLGRWTAMHLISIRAGHRLNIGLMKKLDFKEVPDARYKRNNENSSPSLSFSAC